MSSSIIEDNGSFGVEIDNDPGNDIHTNVISGNTAGGISIAGALATDNTLAQVLIGTQADGTSPLGNAGPGVAGWRHAAGGNNIGGWRSPGTRNTIAFNAGAGVLVLQSPRQLHPGQLRSSLTARRVSTSVATAWNMLIEESDGIQNYPVLTRVASYGGNLVEQQISSLSSRSLGGILHLLPLEDPVLATGAPDAGAGIGAMCALIPNAADVVAAWCSSRQATSSWPTRSSLTAVRWVSTSVATA